MFEWPPNVLVIPPYPEGEPYSVRRSPYPVSMTEVVTKLGWTERRRGVLDGLLRHRALLRAKGVLQAVQWLDGSFMEHKEISGRVPSHPKDVDVVTWVLAWDDDKVAEQLEFASQHDEHKADYLVDHYLHDPEMDYIVYWYSLFSHRRDQTWKGMVEVSLSSDLEEDKEPWELLAAMSES